MNQEASIQDKVGFARLLRQYEREIGLERSADFSQEFVEYLSCLVEREADRIGYEGHAALMQLHTRAERAIERHMAWISRSS